MEACRTPNSWLTTLFGGLPSIRRKRSRVFRKDSLQRKTVTRWVRTRKKEHTGQKEKTPNEHDNQTPIPRQRYPYHRDPLPRTTHYSELPPLHDPPHVQQRACHCQLRRKHKQEPKPEAHSKPVVHLRCHDHVNRMDSLQRVV